MITFIDTNVLLDVFLPDPVWGIKSKNALNNAFEEGSLLINTIVYAELVPQFKTREHLDSALKNIGIRILPIDTDTAYNAGKTWQMYRNSGGKRESVIADFLIGAHAMIHTDRLLTRDRGFYKKYFKSLRIMQV